MTSTGHPDTPAGTRLQKVLSAAGIASRRAAEELIVTGRVSVNGAVVRVLGTRVDPEADVVRVDGARIAVRPGVVHLAVNKPAGVVTTMQDERGRPSIGELVAGRGTGLFHVGRLDQDTEGLLLVTNDGELGHRLTHPRWGVPKTYLAEVEGNLEAPAMRRIRAGVELDGRAVEVDRLRVVSRKASGTLVEIVVHEGRKHVVRRLFDEVGHPVRRLARTAIGPVHLEDLPSGVVRALRREEVSALYRLVEL
jgi:23S rRNA pseudouridine2605 synthase